MSNPKIVKTIHVRLTEDEEKIFNAVSNFLRLRNDAEVIRFLISKFYNENKDKMTPPYEHLNLDEKGVKVIDNTGSRRFVADIYFRPEGIWCDYCQASICPHIDFALKQEDVIRVVRKRRAEGWKLPDV